MKVLVTGATGFVGRHVVAELLRRGHEVTTVSRDAVRARGVEWFGDVDHVACDLHRVTGDALQRLAQADAGVHLAWPGLPNYRALFHVEQNLPADMRLLSGLVRAGLHRLLVTGTCFEYGMRSGCLAEDLCTDPDNPYGLAKDTLRRYLGALQRETPFALQWARLFYLHGPGQNPNSLLAQLDRSIDAGAPSFDMSGGEQLRDYLPIEDAAERLVALLERPSQQGVFNLCSGRPVSVRNLVERHIADRGAPIRINLGRYPYPDHEPLAFWGDPARLQAALDSPAHRAP